MAFWGFLAGILDFWILRVRGVPAVVVLLRMRQSTLPNQAASRLIPTTVILVEDEEGLSTYGAADAVA